MSEGEKLGSVLKIARENKGLTVEEIADKTKIKRGYIIALEQGEYKKLPPILYAKGFVKILAKEYQLENEELFHLLSKELGVEEGLETKEVNESEKNEPEKEFKLLSFFQNKTMLLLMMALGIYVVILIVKIFIGGLSLGNSQKVTVFQAPSNAVISGSSGASSYVSGSGVSGGAGSVNVSGSAKMIISPSVKTIPITSQSLQAKIEKMKKEQIDQASADSGANID